MATTSRFPGGGNKDNTSRILTNEYQTPAYAASIAIVAKYASTLVKPAALTGALSLTIGVGSSGQPPFVGDKVDFIFTADSTDRVVTFSTGFTATGTLRVSASGTTTAEFIFDGSSWQQVSALDKRASTIDVQTPAYAATISLTTTKRVTFVNVAQLTGALTINAVVTSAVINDKVTFTFGADGTNRVVTFGTNMKSSGTLTVTASKYGTAEFIFDGTNWLQLNATATA
jgi:hypothetical protein